jgi:hypothetical protein
MVAIVPPGNPLARRRWISAEDLAARRLLLYSACRRGFLREVLRPAGLKPARVSFIMLTEAMIQLARRGRRRHPAVLVGAARGGQRRRHRCPSRDGRCGGSGSRRRSPRSRIPYLVDFIDLVASARSPRARGSVNLHERHSSIAGKRFAGVMHEPGVG